MTELAGTVTIEMSWLFEVLVVAGALALAYWTKDFIMYFISGIVLILIPTYWVDNFAGVVVVLWAMGIYQLARGILLIFQSGGQSRGLSQFKGWYHRIRGQRGEA